MFEYPKKIILSVAPVAHVGTKIPPGVKNPLAPEEIAEDVLACARAGTSMVHLHVRDLRGEQVFDLGLFSRTLDLIRAESDIVIQGSTGGMSTLTLEQRCVSVTEPRTQVASLNMGSTNFGEGVYVNTIPDIRFWAAVMKKHGVVPELEIFDTAMLTTTERLVADGTLEGPVNYNFSLGFKGALPADPRNLPNLVSFLPSGSHWGVLNEGMTDLRLMAAALGFGATAVRVGFEDGFYYAPGRIAKSNAELAARLADLVLSLGFDIATPEEARKILGVKKT